MDLFVNSFFFPVHFALRLLAFFSMPYYEVWNEKKKKKRRKKRSFIIYLLYAICFCLSNQLHCALVEYAWAGVIASAPNRGHCSFNMYPKWSHTHTHTYITFFLCVCFELSIHFFSCLSFVICISSRSPWWWQWHWTMNEWLWNYFLFFYQTFSYFFLRSLACRAICVTRHRGTWHTVLVFTNSAFLISLFAFNGLPERNDARTHTRPSRKEITREKHRFFRFSFLALHEM